MSESSKDTSGVTRIVRIVAAVGCLFFLALALKMMSEAFHARSVGALMGNWKGGTMRYEDGFKMSWIFVAFAGVWGYFAIRPKSVVSSIVGRRPTPKLDPKHPLVIALSRELRALHAMPIASKQEREAWYSEAGKLRAKLYEDYKDIYDSLPYQIEHYLADADIRAKDEGYMRYQEKMLSGLLHIE